MEDRVCWKLNRLVIYNKFLLRGNNGAAICRRKTLPRVAFFAWTMALGKILAVDNHVKCGMTVVGWCIMCK